jgi:phosphotransferase system HPr-like phosphotransfer protein
MKTVHINLDSIEKVKGFVNLIAACDGDIDLTSDRYVVDAKSIMGIFSLNLSKNLKLDIHDDAVAEAILPSLQGYIV